MMDPRDSRPGYNHNKQQQQKNPSSESMATSSSSSGEGVENRISPTDLIHTAAVSAAVAAGASNTSLRDSSSANYIQAPTPLSTTTRNLKHDSSGLSGSHNNSGNTSSSGNAGAVTSANNNTNSTGESGDDNRSSSGSRTGGTSGSGSGGNQRFAGEASGEYYFAGYGSSVAGDGTQGPYAGAENAVSAVPTQAANNNGMDTMNIGHAMLSFASF
jgi:hypothetical protein